MPNFIKLCEEFNFKGGVSQLDDWGTWASDTVSAPDSWSIKYGIFSDQNVLDKKHPNWNECKTLVTSINSKNIFIAPRLKKLLEI